MFTITIDTAGQGLYEFTDEVCAHLPKETASSAVLTLFVQHTSASLVIQENADLTVQQDLTAFFARIAPEHEAYAHDTEGPDDMPAHIKSALTATSLSIPVIDGDMTLGTWQGIYLFEHRTAPHKRRVIGALTPSI